MFYSSVSFLSVRCRQNQKEENKYKKGLRIRLETTEKNI